MEKFSFSSIMDSTELNVIRGGNGNQDDAFPSISSSCDCGNCCGPCDAISMSGMSASRNATAKGSQKDHPIL